MGGFCSKQPTSEDDNTAKDNPIQFAASPVPWKRCFCRQVAPAPSPPGGHVPRPPSSRCSSLHLSTLFSTTCPSGSREQLPPFPRVSSLNFFRPSLFPPPLSTLFPRRVPKATIPEEDSSESAADQAEPCSSETSLERPLSVGSKSGSFGSLVSFFPFCRSSSKRKKGPMEDAGFPNIGNTCFMNATLQAVFGLSSFCGDIMRQESLWSPERDTVLMLLRYVGELFKARQGQCSYKGKWWLLSSIKRSLAEYNEEYYDYSEQDAHEFLILFLTRMKLEGETLQAATVSLQYICPVQNFEFKLWCVRICSSCADKVHLEEEHNSLSLDLKPSLVDSIKLYFQASALEFTCRKCSGYQGIVVRRFLTLPRVLVLHMKRFHHDGEEVEKVHDALSIPPLMSLAFLCEKQLPGMDKLRASLQAGDHKPSQAKLSSHTASVDPLEVSADRDRDQQTESVKAGKKRTTYRLTGVVSHLGDTMDSGHYISDVEDHGRGWFTLNDSLVRKTDEATVLDKRKDTAYLLFYVLW